LTRELRRLRAEHARLGFEERRFIVHTHSSKAGVIGRLAAVRAGAPEIIHTIHGFGFHEGQHPLKHALFLNAERMAAQVTNTFVGVSRANLAEARAKGIIRSHHRVRLIRSGMDLAPFKNLDSRRNAARTALGIAPEDEAIVCIGNFKPQKDPLTMVEAMRILVKTRPHALLLFAGDGELRSDVERAVARAELSARVRLLGWWRDIPELLAACDLVALSSIFEGLPRSAVQAVAARRTFVGTRVDGTSEIIHDGKNGFLVEPRDPEALATALALALVVRPIDPADEKRIVDWDADRMVRSLEELYLESVVG
jgi:glycosyltransferase involved in cell wall biosynthesis